MDFQNEYDSTTSNIDDVVSTQLSSSLSWASIPGGLVKASSSTAGYLWGYNSNNLIYACQLPCTGNWKPVDTKFTVKQILDLVTDNTNVYILMTPPLGESVIVTGAANNQGTWNGIELPPGFKARNIFSTNTYLWIQDDQNRKHKCAKPCTTGNWIAVPENKIAITSSSETSLYGKDASGNAYKTDENLKAEWTSISGLTGLKLANVVSQPDGSAIYGIDKSSKAYRCEGDCSTPDELDPLDTGGYMPLNITGDGKNITMTTSTSGDKGNIFTRVDRPDYTSIMDNITPLDQNRDKTVMNIADEYNKNTDAMVTNKQVSTIVDFFSKFFKFDSENVERDISEASAYKDKIAQNKTKLNQITATEPLIQKIIVLLMAVVVIYLFGTFLGEIVHVVAFIVMVGGFGFIYYSSKS